MRIVFKFSFIQGLAKRLISARRDVSQYVLRMVHSNMEAVTRRDFVTLLV